MKFKIVKPVDIDVKYLDVFVGDNVYPEDIDFGDNKDYEGDWDEVFKNYPLLKGNCGGRYAELYLHINVETGIIENWPENHNGSFDTVKVIDCGTYILRDNNLNELVKYEGYVPNCLEINREGYGDYFEFNIKNGTILNWSFTQDDVNELFGIEKEN